MQIRNKSVAGALASMFVASSLCLGVVAPAAAGQKSREKNWRIGTYVGSAATAYALARGKGTWALIGAGATLLSYSQWKKEVKNRHRREGRYSDYQRYRRNWYAHNRRRR
jgi:hypothetical protein